MSKNNTNREILKELSRKAEEIRKQKIEAASIDTEKTMWAKRSINWILLHEIYEVGEAAEFKTFDQWKNEGATVRRNEKAFVIWGQLMEAKEYTFFPLVYLFSDLQVYKPTIKEEQQPDENKEEKQGFEPVNGDDLM